MISDKIQKKNMYLDFVLVMVVNRKYIKKITIQLKFVFSQFSKLLDTAIQFNF